MTQSLRDAALAYAAAGRKIFPCLPGTKFPATEHGFHNATNDLETVRKWWDKVPDYNIAWQPQTEGLCVIDIDGQEGEDAWTDLQIERGFTDDTYTITTPRGGRHLYFRGELPPSQSKLAPHVDTRGGGSYALLAPSRHSGAEYRVTADIKPVPVPKWVGTAIAERSKTKLTSAIDVLDDPSNVYRAIAYLRNEPGAIEGQGGDTKTFSIFAGLQNFGLSEQTAMSLFAEHYNPKCVPEWDLEEAATKCGNAYRYAENEAGSWAVDPEAVNEFTLPPEPAKAPRKGVQLLAEEDMDALPPITWLVEGIIQEGATHLWHAPFGSFKSYIATDLMMAVAAGQKVFNALPVARPGPVIYLAGEGAQGFAKLRRPAWRKARGITTPVPIYLVKGVPPARDQDTAQEYFDAIAGLGVRPSLIVVDTLARAMVGLNENDTDDVTKYAEEIAENMATAFDCAVLTIAHEGKDTSRGARGSSAIPSTFANVARIEADTDHLTASLIAVKVKDGELFQTVHVKGRKVAVGDDEGLAFDKTEHAFTARTSDPGFGAAVGAALRKAGATEANNRPVPTQVLAHDMCGTDAAPEMVAAKVRQLNRAAKRGLKAYLAHEGTGGPDGHLWWLPKMDDDASEAAVFT